MTKITKKIIAIVTAAALVLVIGGISTQRLVKASAFDSARSAAANVVPSGAALMIEERTDREFRFEFIDENNGEQYKVSVDRDDRSQIKVQSRIVDLSGSEQVLLSKDEIMRLIYEIYPQSIVSSVSLIEDRNGYLYNVVFSTDQIRGQFLINPQTGDVVERVLRYGSSLLVVSLSQDDEAMETVIPEQNTNISLEEARVAALEAVPGGKIKTMEYGEHNYRLTIEVVVEKDDFEHEVTLDAQNGEIIESGMSSTNAPEPTTAERDQDQKTTETKPVAETTKPSAPTLIGIIRVEQIVGGKAAGAFIIELELERDDGRVYYEGAAIAVKMEYEFEIDAYTGALIKWSVDDYDGEIKDGGIGFAQVKSIVLNKVPGAVIIEIDLETDDGKVYYEVYTRKNGVEYEFEIDAYTGEILEWEIDD